LDGLVDVLLRFTLNGQALDVLNVHVVFSTNGVDAARNGAHLDHRLFDCKTDNLILWLNHF